MAGFNINTFRSQGLVYGGARPTNFSVTLAFPNLVAAAYPQVSKKLTLLCRSASLPDSSMGTVPVAYFGRTTKVAGNRQFDDWDVTVYNDEDFLIRDAFEYWHNSINTIISNRLDPRVANISPDGGNSYKTTASVTQFSKKGPGDIDGDGAIKTYEFDGLFPTMISSIPLAYDDLNTIETFQVRFAYDWYAPLKKSSGQPIFPIELSPE